MNMEIITGELEIEGQKFENCTSITLKQGFNEHHEFICRYLDEGNDDSLSLTSFQHKIGKTAIIRFYDPTKVYYEFRGTVCEVSIEAMEIGAYSQLVVTGYSTTIQLESGEDFATFHEKKVADIVQKIVQTAGLTAKIKTKHQAVLPYKCQYRESAFNFLNRLSADYGEYFFYDGKDLFFGQPEGSKTFQVTYGEDILGMQLSVRALPVNFSNHDYDEKKDAPLSGKPGAEVKGLGQFSNNVFKTSGKIFSKSTINAFRNIVDGSDLRKFAEIQQAAFAANMEVLTVKTDNPEIHIGAIVKLRMGTFKNKEATYEDYGEFLVTNIEHTITGEGYTNTIQAIPAGLEVIPVKNVAIPIAETQLAIVKDNKDKDKIGRVQVQMLWQKENNDKTDWISVMTPDAGQGKDGKNRGHLCIPEIDDKVMVGFRYNNPDRPFVLGSVFTGQTGAGGGDDNKIKSFTTNSGSTIKFEDEKISIIDAKKKSKILYDGKGKIDIESDEEIMLTCGQSSINMKKDGTIQIKGKEITLDASSKVVIKSMGNVEVKATADAKIEGLNTELSAQVGAKVKGNATAEITASGQTTVKGAIVMIN